ncbi:hypothetical protein AN0278.2 [Aspergillus nidulans FGSC A4]|nr:hypothetical protein AN0278.2 [Aspergillus nidulans FGSC A4]|eukprot:XP_657882.1 hypothetical protein AN0278.2 [Aspergillus nidulans FGSC A4]
MAISRSPRPTVTPPSRVSTPSSVATTDTPFTAEQLRQMLEHLLTTAQKERKEGKREIA